MIFEAFWNRQPVCIKDHWNRFSNIKQRTSETVFAGSVCAKQAPGIFLDTWGAQCFGRKKIPVHDQKQCCTISMRSLPPSPSLYMGRRTQTATWAKSCRPADFEGINWDQFQWCYHCWSSQSPVHPPSFRCFGSNWPYPWILAVEFTMFQSVEKNRLFSHILFDVDDTVRFRRLAPHVSLA